MAIYEDIVKDMGEPPARPWNLGILGFNFNEGAMEDWRRKKAIYDAAAGEAAKLRVDQALNPLRDTNIGQIAELMNMPPEDLASPDQYRTRQVTEPSAVPSYRYVPTMSQDPALPPMGRDVPSQIELKQIQGPPTLEMTDPYRPYESAKDDKRHMYEKYPTAWVPVEPPITRAQGPEGYAEGTPQVRRVSSPLGGVFEGQPTQPYQADAGRFEPSRGPDVQYGRREVDLQAPSNLYQQTLGMQGAERESKWPRGTSGSTVLAQKAAMLRAVGVPEDQIAMVLAGREYLPGGTQDQALRQRMDTGAARADDLREHTRLAPQRQRETERHNKMMEQFRRESLANTETWRSKMQEAQSNKDWIQLERLNEAKYWHDQLLIAFGAIDKADILSEDQQNALMQGLGIVQQMMERPATPDEIGILESLLGGPRPRYKYTPRPPVQPPAKGLAPPMSRTESQSGSRTQRQSSAGIPTDDAAELASAKASAAGQKAGAQYQTKSGKLYTWDGADFKPAQ